MILRAAVTVVLLAVAACAAQPESNEKKSDDVAFVVFERWAGLNDIKMKPGTNIRTFNKQYGSLAGVKLIGDTSISLSNGTYRVSGLSITTFGYTTGQAVRSVPGYAFFWRTDGAPLDSIYVLGSMQDAQYSEPSLVDGVFTVEGTGTFQLGHQNGDTVDGVFMETGHAIDKHNGGHLFARVVVQRLAQ